LEDFSEPPSWFLLNILNSLSFGFVAGCIVMCLLLVCSALISGAEVAFFSLAPKDLKELEDSKSRTSKTILDHLKKPQLLLATILIGNNFVNVAIIVLSTYITKVFISFTDNIMLVFTIQVVAVTFLILLIGEVIPKVYATTHALRLAAVMAMPLKFLQKIFKPLSLLLISSTSIIDKRIKRKGGQISVDELAHALEITRDEEASEEEEKIFKGIVKFGSTDVKQIMKSRVDVVAFDVKTSYEEMLEEVLESGFSRIPVFKESFDHIEGILYIKDLLPLLGKENINDWQKLIRQPFFVPENKKIDDLLKEFQEKKIHLAIVVDEYGGTSGIVTLEDIIEEIVGDITDEFDEEELAYSKLDKFNYVFDGKTALNDLYRVLEIDGILFEEAKGESDTIAGFVLELAGKIPKKNEKIVFNNYRFTIESADTRRIKRVKITILKKQNHDVPMDKHKTNGNGKHAASILLLMLGIGALMFTSCENPPVPKPKGYFRIDLPEKEYVRYDEDCPFTFEYPNIAMIEKDNSRVTEPCWINIAYPAFKGKIHLSYKKVEGNIREYLEDARELAMKHTVKASSIEEELVMIDSTNVFGLVYYLQGSTASSCQFFLTDSVNHFLRGALYFNAPPNPDSIAPVDNYIKQDIRHFINTFKWKPRLEEGKDEL